MLHIFESKLPPDLHLFKPSSNARIASPHLLLADSLIAIMKQPLHFARHASSTSLIPDSSRNKGREVSNLIVNRFICEVACSKLSPFVYNYVIPSLRSDPSFPRSLLLSQIVSQASGHLEAGSAMKEIVADINLLAAVVRLCEGSAGLLRFAHVSTFILLSDYLSVNIVYTVNQCLMQMTS